MPLQLLYLINNIVDFYNRRYNISLRTNSNNYICWNTHKLPPGETSPITVIVPIIGVQTVSSAGPLVA